MIKPVDFRNVSVANLTVGGGDPVALIEAAAASGLGAVGLLVRTATPKPVSHEIIGRPDVIRNIRAACAANDVRVFDMEAFVLQAGTRIADYRLALETSAELGATHISCIGAEWIGKDVLLSQAERIDLFGQLCDAAASFDLTVGVEFMLYRDVRTLAEALALIEGANRRNAGVIFDVLHFHRGGGKAAEVAAIPAGRVAYVQLCDAAATAPSVEGLAVEARTNRLHLGQGAIDLRGILAEVPSDAQLVLEIPVQAEAHLSPADKVRSCTSHARAFFEAERSENRAGRGASS